MLLRSTLLILIFVAYAWPQASDCDAVRQQLANLRVELIEKIHDTDYDKAYKLAEQMLRIGETNCSKNDDVLLTLRMNVAQIQVSRKKFDEALKIYDQNFDLAEKVYDPRGEDFQKYTERLLKFSADAVNEIFESTALKVLEAKRKRFGEASSEYVNELTRIAHSAWKKPELAEKYFLKAMEVADKLPQDKDSGKQKAVNGYRVLLITRYGEKEGLIRGEALMRSRYPDLPAPNKALNGYAYSLPRPAYPAEARNMRASGEIRVNVTVDENGHVISAQAVDGNPFLIKVAEAAAKDAKFLPTFLKGEPVKVTGVITYIFHSY